MDFLLGRERVRVVARPLPRRVLRTGAMLGLLQGVSELFPVSSLGHSVILPKLVGWNIHQDEPYFLSFLVATHLATERSRALWAEEQSPLSAPPPPRRPYPGRPRKIG